MQRQRGELVPIGEVIGGLGGPVKALREDPPPALIPAVDLPPIAGPADVKHRPATRASAKQLPSHHFSGHAPHDSIAA